MTNAAPLASPTARAVLVAAGSASRMGTTFGVRKPLIEIDGRSLLEHACAALNGAQLISSIVVVAHPEDVDSIRALCARSSDCAKTVAIVPGGAERIDSVRSGCDAEPTRREAAFGLFCIHDAARPFVSSAAIDDAVQAAERDGSALLAIPVADTLKHSDDGARVERTLERAKLWAAQTPQVFERARFLECLERARRDGVLATDDAALWERYIGPVTLVRGDAANLKITSPSDLELARAAFELRRNSPARTQS